jgi:uncharacterized protein
MRLLITLFLGIYGAYLSFAQFDIPSLPDRQTALYDYASLLSKGEQQALERKLVTYADSTSTQIVVAIIESAKGEDLGLLGAKWAQKWGIGQVDQDNGIFILLAHGDRRIDINTGYGIEYRMTDLQTERVINRVMIPLFKRNDYYGGLMQGADAIFAHLTGEFKESRNFDKVKIPWRLIIFMIFVLIIIIATASRNGGDGSGGRKGRAPSLLDVIILSNMGRGSYGGGFGRSSGGFGSGGGFSGGFGGGFGGGGFGGGGAGGSW